MNDIHSRLNQPNLERIIGILPAEIPMYLVGGAIRDALLNRPNFDLDFVTPHDGLKIARLVADRLGGAYFPLDHERKVGRVILKVDHQGNQARGNTEKIDFSTFQGSDLIEDLSGRDFTINAMAMEVHYPGKLIDPLGGAGDLLSRRLKTCSAGSLKDDPVRVLRAVRFSVNLGLNIPAETIQLIKQACGRIPDVSEERLRDELFRILVQPHPATAIRILDSLTALEYILPELCALKGINQSLPHILDAWEHTLDLISQMEKLLDLLAGDFDTEKTENLVMGLTALQLGHFRNHFQLHMSGALNPDRPHRGLIFLAGLYHDVGKVKSQEIDESGKTRFIGHASISGQQAEKRGKELRLSNEELERLVAITRNHMRPSLLSHETELPSNRTIYRFFRKTGVAGVDVCILSLADVLATYGATLPQERWTRHLDVVRALLSAWWEDYPGKILPPSIINGNDLINVLELSPGPLIGSLLESIREAQVSGEIQTREEAISLANYLVENYKTRQGDN